ncbi:MAG: 5'/3'-nucleotidase SurE [Planctomycetaceae bacterium]|jgi:5'-nucleotidase|nr:5'/3'-nucleotidase SurE [Planctomycetaceae bacterium]MBP61193.1 5'/3'-nucleotidase SurE [Planctomycetaceae bacterium]
MKFLVSNDDGVEAPGLSALVEVLSELGEVTVVAPAQELSGCSHQTTTHAPLQVTRLAPDRHAVHGTPADCVRLGLLHLAPDVDWVFSGINNGGNLGVDVYMSGTVAAAREAAWMGKPAIALSQYRSTKEPVIWPTVIPQVRRVIAQLRSETLPAGAFWNVNLPECEQAAQEARIVTCPLESAPLPVRFEIQNGQFQYRATYQDRLRKPGSDVDVCFSGDIAVTRIP